MRQNLLEITQHILSAMDSDEVNSISDTVESFQVANLLKQVYYDIASDLRLPTNETIFQLEASLDPAKPCMMSVPTNITKVDWIKYNNYLPSTEGETEPNWVPVKLLPFDEFILRSNGLRGRNSSDTGVQTLSFNGEDFEFMYLNNKMPEFYTDVGNLSFIFDSYLDTEDNTLQQSKTMCGGLVYPTFTLSDTFYPPLDPTQFSYYINKAKARAFIELKQQENKEAASEARRQKIITQVRKDRTENLTALQKITRYGR